MIHFSNPKVQASIAANTYVVSGPNETKPLTEMLPGIINQVRLAGAITCLLCRTHERRERANSSQP